LPEGLVLVYNAADQAMRRSVGQALISPSDPTRVLRRAPRPLLTVADRPDLDPGAGAAGIVRFGERWLLYYASGDATIGVASTTYPGRS
jgi:predicted GH43/DUF377 family glycosyl hydrolase